MMAYEERPTPPSLDADTLEALRAALARSLRQGAHDASLGDALRLAAADAQAKGLHVEHVLVALKDLWHSLPEVRGAHSPVERGKLLQQVVTWCIEVYYAGP